MNLLAILFAAAMATATPHAHAMMHSSMMHSSKMHGSKMHSSMMHASMMHAHTSKMHGHMTAKPTPKP